MSEQHIRVDYLARVEGEGALKITVKDSQVVDLRLDIFEPPRFFEAFLRGRSFHEVVDKKGKGDGLFINTSGVGVIEHDLPVSPSAIQVGDAVILSGDIGRHGIAIMAARESLQFETEIESDCAPLHQLTSALFEHGIAVHCLRDLTRGGLATALLELAETSGTHIVIHEDHIAVRDDVSGACEILGLDPLYVANEGRFVAFVPAHEAERALEILRSRSTETVPAIIGEVEATPRGHVTLRSRLGTSRFLHMLSGEQLPRIC